VAIARVAMIIHRLCRRRIDRKNEHRKVFEELQVSSKIAKLGSGALSYD